MGCASIGPQSRCRRVQAVRALPLRLGGLALLFLVLAAAAAMSPGQSLHSVSAQPAPSLDPAAPGPYAVGATRRSFTRLSTTTGAPRILDTVIWYPATTAAVALPRDEHLAATIDAMAERADVPYPVLMLSHGSGAEPWMYTYLTTHLASHGFVIAAPRHLGNASDCPSPCRAIKPPALESLRDAVPNRPVDIVFALDQVLALSGNGDPVLQGLVDAQRIGVLGKSLGGTTALRVVLNDSRFRAVVAMAPPAAPVPLPEGPELVARIRVPTLIMGSLRDDAAPFEEQEQLFTASTASAPEAWLVVFPRGGHPTYDDVCPPARSGCGPEDLPHPQAHALIQRWATPFLLRHVAGDQRYALLLDPALAADDPDIAITVASAP